MVTIFEKSTGVDGICVSEKELKLDVLEQLIPASLLSDDVVTIDNIPHISDIEALNEILNYFIA